MPVKEENPSPFFITNNKKLAIIKIKFKMELQLNEMYEE